MYICDVINLNYNIMNEYELTQKIEKILNDNIETIQYEGKEIDKENIIFELVKLIKQGQLLPIQRVSNSLSDLDGKTIPVKFKVSKFKPKIIIDIDVSEWLLMDWIKSRFNAFYTVLVTVLF